MISILGTLGISVITAAVKCLSEDTLGKAALASLDTVFSGVLGNVCHEGYNRLKQYFSNDSTFKQNADIERCSRDALLQALIAFSEAAKLHVSTQNISQSQLNDSIRFLNEAQKHFKKQLEKLPNLPDTAEILNSNPMASEDVLTHTFTKRQDDWVDSIMISLTEFALNEYTYKPGHILYEKLVYWLSHGLPDKKHWFIFYIHALHANLKKDDPYYCKSARRILSQKQLADLHLLSKRNLSRLDRLLTLTREINGLLSTVNEKLDLVKDDTSAIREELRKINHQTVISKYLNTFAHYDLSNLVGREAQLSAIEVHLQKHQLLLLQGIGGIGKTTLAKAFISQAREDYDHISYVEIVGSIAESMLSQLGNSSDVGLKIDAVIDPDTKFEALIEILRHVPNLLLVLDNANDADDLRLRKPQLESLDAKILITGRAKPQSFVRDKIIQEVGSMTAYEAMKMFKRHYTQELTGNDSFLVEGMLRAAYYHPKLIEVIAKAAYANAFISLQGIADIVERKDYDDGDINYPIEIGYQTKKIYRVLLDLFDTSNLSENQQNLLRNFAILPSIDIPLMDLALLLEIKSTTEKQNFISTLNSLIYTGWLQEANNRSFSMHGLIQWVVRNRLKPTSLDCRPIITGMCNTLSHGSAENPLEKQRYLLYSVDWLAIFANDIDDVLAKAFGWIGAICGALGDHRQQLTFYQKAVEIREAEPLPNYPDLATTYSNISIAHANLGDIKRALFYDQKALAIREAVLPPNHLDLASSYNNLAETYGGLGDHHQCLAYHKKALAILEAVLDHNHQDLAFTYNNLAVAYLGLGDYQHCFAYHQKAIVILEAMLPPNHPDLAFAYNTLAVSYGTLGDYQQCLVYLKKAITIQEEILPPTHPGLAISYNNLAATYGGLGDHQKCLVYDLKAVTIRESILAFNHPELAISYNNLAISYFRLNNLEQALFYIQKAVVIREYILPEEHSHLINSRRTLSLIQKEIKSQGKCQ